MSYSTTIKPKEPFFLFVPSLEEMPKEVLQENKGKWFALGEFFQTKTQAQKKIKQAGYNDAKTKILIQQKYFGKVI